MINFTNHSNGEFTSLEINGSFFELSADQLSELIVKGHHAELDLYYQHQEFMAKHKD